MGKTATVTARIPAELRAQSYRVLEEMGRTPSELINQALLYVLETHSFPQVGTTSQTSARDISTAQEHIRERARAMRLAPRAQAVGVLDMTDAQRKELIAEGKRARYEALP